MNLKPYNTYRMSAIIKSKNNVLYKSTYNTRRNEDVGTFIVVPKFQSTIYKSTRQFGFSFAFDAPTIWNALPNEVRACPSIGSFRRKLKAYVFTKAYPP